LVRHPCAEKAFLAEEHVFATFAAEGTDWAWQAEDARPTMDANRD